MFAVHGIAMGHQGLLSCAEHHVRLGQGLHFTNRMGETAALVAEELAALRFDCGGSFQHRLPESVWFKEAT